MNKTSQCILVHCNQYAIKIQKKKNVYNMPIRSISMDETGVQREKSFKTVFNVVIDYNTYALTVKRPTIITHYSVCNFVHKQKS